MERSAVLGHGAAAAAAGSAAGAGAGDLTKVPPCSRVFPPGKLLSHWSLNCFWRSSGILMAFGASRQFFRMVPGNGTAGGGGGLCGLGYGLPGTNKISAA